VPGTFGCGKVPGTFGWETDGAGYVWHELPGTFRGKIAIFRVFAKAFRQGGRRRVYIRRPVYFTSFRGRTAVFRGKCRFFQGVRPALHELGSPRRSPRYHRCRLRALCVLGACRPCFGRPRPTRAAWGLLGGRRRRAPPPARVCRGLAPGRCAVRLAPRPTFVCGSGDAFGGRESISLISHQNGLWDSARSATEPAGACATPHVGRTVYEGGQRDRRTAMQDTNTAATDQGYEGYEGYEGNTSMRCATRSPHRALGE
jgi:hypothetical protein